MGPRLLQAYRGLAAPATSLLLVALLLVNGGPSPTFGSAHSGYAWTAGPLTAGPLASAPRDRPMPVGPNSVESHAAPDRAGPMVSPLTAGPAPSAAPTVTILTALASPASGAAPLLVNLTGSAHGGPNATQITFNWTFGDGQPNAVSTVTVAGGATASAIVPHTYQLLVAGVPIVYNATVNVSDNGGDKNATSHKVFVTVTPVLTLTASATPHVVTLGHEVSLVPSAGGGLPPYKFSWSGTPSGCNPGTVDLNCTTSGPGTYIVRVSVSDAAGNHNSTAANFTVNPSIVLLAGYQGFFACTGTVGSLQDNFSANVTGGTPPYAYSWSFGDASPGVNGSRINHVYVSSGNYTARVSVNDSGGASANYSLKVSATFGSCGAAAPPSFGAPLVAVEAAVALAFVLVVVLAIAVLLQRRRHGGATAPRAWNRELEPPKEAAPPAAPRRPTKPAETPPPEEGTVQ